VLIIASQESELPQLLESTCTAVPKSDILTKSKLDKLSNILTTFIETTRNQRLTIKTTLRFKVP
jgi:hypothetical protein